MTNDIKAAATLDRLALILRRSVIYPDERDDIAFALSVLCIDPTDDDLDHSLIDLYRALHLSASNGGLIYLSAEHRLCLTQVLDEFGRMT